MSKYEYGWITPQPTKRERFIRWLLRQPKMEKHDYTLTFPVSKELKPGMRIRITRTKGGNHVN